MTKLVIKQETTPVSWWKQYKTLWLSSALLLALIAAVILIKWPLQSYNVSSDVPVTMALSSASDEQAKAMFLAEQQQLVAFTREYQQLRATETDELQKNIQLLNHSELVIQHLAWMDSLIAPIGLENTELDALQRQQQYLKDDWRAKQHFHELRLASLQGENAVSVQVTLDQNQVIPIQPIANKNLAEPPEGMELPAGFCTLDGDGVCKPEASQ